MADDVCLWPKVDKAVAVENAVTRDQNVEPAQPSTPSAVGRAFLQDQQFEERLGIAEHIVQALGKAGYSCEPDDGHARALRPKN